MSKNRMEAFSDGVFAIIITIMVLELKVPLDTTLASLKPLISIFFSYVMSFVYLGIYWNNHHHLLQAVHRVTGPTLWANLHLLFWLTLIPITTAWMGENNFASWPVALYGVVLFFAGMAYFILERILIAAHEKDSPLVRAVGSDVKAKISIGLYLVAILLAPWKSSISCSLYVFVAMLWFIPDRRIEKALGTG